MDKNNDNNWICLECGTKINPEDNFCPMCGHWTAKGYTFLQDETNVNEIIKGKAYKQEKNFNTFKILLGVLVIFFLVFTFIRGKDMFKPYAYLKKQFNSLIYGYNSSILKTNNIYNHKIVNDKEIAKKIIINDFNSQSWMCSTNLEIKEIELQLEKDYDILSVNFCDMSLENVEKIKKVIDKIYELFPNIKGNLTNITITNAVNKEEYIAYFQPMYQFVNVNMDINEYNKVNKTQILLNSYYFLNDNILKNSISTILKKNQYVKDATWESTIAHELGHYISFSALLKTKGIEDILLVTKNNSQEIEQAIEEFDSGSFSKSIIIEALKNYNEKYKENITVEGFVKKISDYAGVKNADGEFIYDEAIAEAIHDYYLHEEKSSLSSKEIINVIKTIL